MAVTFGSASVLIAPRSVTVRDPVVNVANHPAASESTTVFPTTDVVNVPVEAVPAAATDPEGLGPATDGDGLGLTTDGDGLGLTVPTGAPISGGVGSVPAFAGADMLPTATATNAAALTRTATIIASISPSGGTSSAPFIHHVHAEGAFCSLEIANRSRTRHIDNDLVTYAVLGPSDSQNRRVQPKLLGVLDLGDGVRIGVLDLGDEVGLNG